VSRETAIFCRDLGQCELAPYTDYRQRLAEQPVIPDPLGRPAEPTTKQSEDLATRQILHGDVRREQ
jgi:hypothetical protein